MNAPAFPPATLLPPLFPDAWASAWGQDHYGLWQAFTVNGVSQVMRWIPPGEFLMGSPGTEKERNADENQHWVVLTEGYWLADSTCTQALWQAVMGENRSRFKGEDRPVENVSWQQVTEDFLPSLNALLTGLEACLPSEAQWEYACRAGTTTPFWFGANITPEEVNYNGNFPYADGEKGLHQEETVEVKALPANGWGLYQMHGNVWEWCVDWLGPYELERAVDPIGAAEGRARALRGGGWFLNGGLCRSAKRYGRAPGERHALIGFRLARGASPR